MFHLMLLSPDYDIFSMLVRYVMHMDVCLVLVVFLPALEMLIFPAFLDWHIAQYSSAENSTTLTDAVPPVTAANCTVNVYSVFSVSADDRES